jgi:hypothetical protein
MAKLTKDAFSTFRNSMIIVKPSQICLALGCPKAPFLPHELCQNLVSVTLPPKEIFWQQFKNA